MRRTGYRGRLSEHGLVALNVAAAHAVAECFTRGDSPLDAQALARTAVQVGGLIVAAQGRIASFDLRPVLRGAAGEGAAVVDALVALQGGQAPL